MKKFVMFEQKVNLFIFNMPGWETKSFANLIECYHINRTTRTKHLIENHDNLVFFSVIFVNS